MEPHALTRPRPLDWPARALTAGLAATIVTQALFLVAHGLAWLLSTLPLAEFRYAELTVGQVSNPRAWTGTVSAIAIPGGETLRQWLAGLTHSHLTDPGRVEAAIAAAAFLVTGLAWALVYALWVEPRLPGPGWWRGVAFAIVPTIVWTALVLPLLGGGLLGLGLGAGPLPLIGSLLGYVAYGAVLGATYGAATNRFFGPASAADVLTLRRATRTYAVGVLAGGAGGLIVGAVILTLAAFSVPAGPAWLPPVGILLASTLLGMASGGLLGSLAGLPVGTGAGPRADLWVPPGSGRRAESAADRASTPDGRSARSGLTLRVVSVNGDCPNGYRLGDRFTCSDTGELSPAICPAAARAVEPIVAQMLRGDREAPAWVACPIEEHMLVLELEGHASRAMPSPVTV